MKLCRVWHSEMDRTSEVQYVITSGQNYTNYVGRNYLQDVYSFGSTYCDAHSITEYVTRFCTRLSNLTNVFISV